MRIRSVVLVCGLLCVAATASAQGYYPPPRGGYYSQPSPGIHRGGLVFGGSIGPGAFTFSDCGAQSCDSTGALALQLELGGMVAPNLALMFDWTGQVHPFSDGTVLSANLFDGALRYFFGRIFWIEGGLGIGWRDQTDEFGYVWNDGWGLGLLGAFGIEILQTYNFALDLQIRGTWSRIYGDPDVNISTGALLIGIHWY